MTDLTAMLALELEDLRARLSECEASLRMVSKGAASEIDEVKGALIDLVDQVAALHSSPGSESEPAPGKRPPTAWVDMATAPDWTALAAWVDWLTATYEVRGARAVLPCWPAHRGVAEELAALWRAWQVAAVTVAAKQPSDAMIVWHERHLWPALGRLREYTGQHHCPDRHTPHRPGATTNPDLLAAACSTAAETATKTAPPAAGDGDGEDEPPPSPLQVVA